MAQTVTFSLQIDGAPADADTIPVLEDESVAFGVRRTDTLEVIVADGQVMNQVSTGVYEYTFAEPEPDLEYEAVIKFTLFGVDNYQHKIVGVSVAPTEPTDGRYATWAGLKAKYGETSLRKWSRVNGADDAASNAAISAAMVEADSMVDSYLLDGPYDVPFIGTQPELPTLIKQCANMIAGFLLYEAQGIIDFDPESGEPQHRLAAHKKQAMRNLGRIKAGFVRLVLDTGVEYGESSTNIPIAGGDDGCCSYSYLTCQCVVPVIGKIYAYSS